MTPRLQFIPGPHDQLGPVEGIARAVLNDLQAIVGRLPWVEPEPKPDLLNEDQVYVSTVDLPKARWSQHEKALLMQLDQLSPIRPEQAAIAIRTLNSEAAQRTRYQIAIARDADLQGSNSAKVVAPAAAPGLLLRSNVQHKKRRQNLLLTSFGGLLSLGVMLISLQMLAIHLDNDYLATTQALRIERAALADAQRRTQSLQAWSTLSDAHWTERETLWPLLVEITANLPEGLAAETIETADGGLTLYWKDAAIPDQLARLGGVLGPDWQAHTDEAGLITRVERR